MYPYPQINMHPLRASAVNIPLERNASNESGSSSSGGGGGSSGNLPPGGAQVAHVPMPVSITGGPIVLGGPLPPGVDERTVRAAFEAASVSVGAGGQPPQQLQLW